jgi:deferrochelatase/peroxidase EfeB
VASGIFIQVAGEDIITVLTIDNNLAPVGEDWFEITHAPLGFLAYRTPRDYGFKDGELYGK